MPEARKATQLVESLLHGAGAAGAVQDAEQVLHLGLGVLRKISRCPCWRIALGTVAAVLVIFIHHALYLFKKNVETVQETKQEIYHIYRYRHIYYMILDQQCQPR